MPERPRKARSPPEGQIGTAASTAPSRRGDARQRLVPLTDPVAVLGSSKPIPVIVTDVPATPVTGRKTITTGAAAWAEGIVGSWGKPRDMTEALTRSGSIDPLAGQDVRASRGRGPRGNVRGACGTRSRDGARSCAPTDTGWPRSQRSYVRARAAARPRSREARARER